MRKNERTPTGTDVQNCLLGSVSGFILFYFFPTQYTVLGILSSLGKMQMVMLVWDRKGQNVINKIVAYEVRCFNLKSCY